MSQETVMLTGLEVILLAVFILPFIWKRVEQNLEVFLFLMGLASVLVTKKLTVELIGTALKDPIMITAAVLFAGLGFRYFQSHLAYYANRMRQKISLPVILAAMVIILGLVSSVITAIIAALILVELLNLLCLDRESEVNATVIACFSIGLGAVLTPLGEPLATVTIAKLGQNFFYLFDTLGIYIISGILALGVFTYFYIRPRTEISQAMKMEEQETTGEIVLRAGKIYLFVIGLLFLGEGFKPIIDRYILGLDGKWLFWLNMVSACLDNATLAAAEISIKMSTQQ